MVNRVMGTGSKAVVRISAFTLSEMGLLWGSGKGKDTIRFVL